MNFYNVEKNLFDKNHELREIVGSILEKKFSKVTPKIAFSTFILGKAYKTHEAILILCINGYGEDAAMLTRSLFELMVLLLYVLKDKSNKRVLRYYSYDSIIRKEIYDYAISTTPSLVNALEERINNPKPEDLSIEKVQEMAAIAQDRYKYDRRKGWSDKSIRQMANCVNKGGIYNTIYSLFSNISHTAVRVMNDYVKFKPGDSVYTVQVGPSDNWIKENLVASFDFLLGIISRFNILLRLGMASQLNAVAKRYIKEVDRINNS